MPTAPATKTAAKKPTTSTSGSPISRVATSKKPAAVPAGRPAAAATRKPTSTSRPSTAQNKKEDGTVRKKQSFKRIRGLFSRRNKKDGDNKSRSGRSSTGVDVDERSVTSRRTTGESDRKPYLLKVVLLLMDPNSRRFELLQLEFDSLKALVSDVLAQIPISVTEEAMRKQSYKSICGHNGLEMPTSKLLAEYCKGSEVLLAVPTTLPAIDCARLARPILNDSKVVAMVRFGGIYIL